MKEYSKNNLIETIDRLEAIRNAILDLYDDNLYNENWDETTIKSFNSLLGKYDEYVAQIREWMPEIKWSNAAQKEQFMNVFNSVFEEDAEVYKLIKIRNEAYLTYRTNRKSLVWQLNEVIGFVKSKGGKNNKEVFKWFNNRCAKMPLYDNRDTEGRVTVHVYPVLSKWFYEHKAEITDEINHAMEIEDHYDQNECNQIFMKYVQCRKAVFAIFNMLTSRSEVNGYKKWHNVLDAYCEADIRDPQLEKLYNAATSENDFMPTDDFQQISDDRSWNSKGIYESWWADELNGYFEIEANKERERNYNKQDICKIDMKDANANICKIILSKGSVYAGANFYKGDIIEVCPTKSIDRTSLFTKDMRDIVFEVKPNEQWVLPFGYCQYYDIDQSDAANCGFIWDPVAKNIVIKAIKRIPKHGKLILKNIK